LTNWLPLKDVNDSYPVQLAEYAVSRRLHALKKRNKIISKVKTKYWSRTHKYGIELPKSVEHAKQLDLKNGNTLWWDAIMQEMKNVRISFDKFKGELGENFRRKAWYVAGSHMTEPPASITYASVVSRESVRIALLVAALNGLDVVTADIQNAYLHAPCREKIWVKAGPEFGTDAGSIMIREYLQ
jgi:hypothetical protein